MDSGGKHKKGAVGKGKGDEGVSWVGGVDTIMREVGNGSVKREIRQERVSAQTELDSEWKEWELG